MIRNTQFRWHCTNAASYPTRLLCHEWHKLLNNDLTQPVLRVAQHTDSAAQEERRKFVDLSLFRLHQSLVPIVKAAAEHLLSWPLFRRPGQRAYQEEKWMCTCVRDRGRRKKRGRIEYVCVCMHICTCTWVCVRIWSFAAVGALLLMAAHCFLSLCLRLSLSLCPGLFMGLPPPFFFFSAHRS